MNSLIAIALICAVVVAWFLWRIATGGQMPLAATAAPEFTLPDQNAQPKSLVDFRGRRLVLYFYPRDDTPGCTEQAGRFRDAMLEIENLGATVCGISVDDSASHAAFARKYKLPFALLADRDGAVTRRYGSLLNLGFIKFARRNTFLIDPAGKIEKVYVGVNAARNASEVVADLKARAATR